MWGFFGDASVAFLKPIAAESFWPQSTPVWVNSSQNHFNWKLDFNVKFLVLVLLKSSKIGSAVNQPYNESSLDELY
jgi:hypothetical protein